jgi:hypothetical protein
MSESSDVLPATHHDSSSLDIIEPVVDEEAAGEGNEEAVAEEGGGEGDEQQHEDEGPMEAVSSPSHARPVPPSSQPPPRQPVRVTRSRPAPTIELEPVGMRARCIIYFTTRTLSLTTGALLI